LQRFGETNVVRHLIASHAFRAALYHICPVNQA